MIINNQREAWLFYLENDERQKYVLMKFLDRYDAAMQLIPLLAKYAGEDGVILAVPRGGVPIGHEIAMAYHFPMDLLLTKKIGHPASHELAIGAVSLEDVVIDDRHGISDQYIESEVTRIRASLQERFKKFMGDREPEPLTDKTVIIVDDGIATGNTILAAIRLIRAKKPKKIIVAVPVAPLRTAKRLKSEVDDFVCVFATDAFYGVGQFYDDFSQVTDEEVVGWMQKDEKLKVKSEK